MASNINPFNIDGSYPVAGQDNDSQGFRDNFTSIRNNLVIAKSELEDLQAKAVLKSALSGTVLDNNLSNSPLVGAQLKSYSETIVDHSFLGGTTLGLSFGDGNVHKVTTIGNLTITFDTSWPALGLFGELILWVTVTDAQYTIQVPFISPGVTKGLNDIAGCDYVNGILTFDAPGDYVFAFSTRDGGNNILIQDYMRNRVRFRDPTFYFNPDVNPTLLIGFNLNSIELAKTLETGYDAISAHGSYNSVRITDLAKNTIRQVDPGAAIPGYSVSATRGDIDTGFVNIAQSNDFIGYVNSITFTGNIMPLDNKYNLDGNSFTQISSIGYYATGSNITGGLGGNIAFFTRPDGGVQGQHYVYGLNQAVGIENDQSTKFFGNVITANTFVPDAKTVHGNKGQLSYDSSYLYVCLGSGNWKRIAWTAW